MGVSNATASNVSCTCSCKPYTSIQNMEITQLEFVQILVIVVFMMVMVVVITCLLNHYRLSARSLLSRHSPARRRHLQLANEGSLWSSESAAPGAGMNEHQVYNPRPADRGAMSYVQRDPQHAQPPSLLQSQRFQQIYGPRRFQPTYPYMPQGLIDLPPTISLSDGEEPPPYQGPCTLQLRDPEQQMELNRESVRPPPNRTVFDSHALEPSTSSLQARLQAPPPSVHSGISVLEAQEASSRQQKLNSRVEGTPPTYSEAVGHFYHPATLASDHSHRTVLPLRAAPSSLVHGLLRPLLMQQATVDKNRHTKVKPQKPEQV